MIYSSEGKKNWFLPELIPSLHIFPNTTLVVEILMVDNNNMKNFCYSNMLPNIKK